jgi:hypothetical protein
MFDTHFCYFYMFLILILTSSEARQYQQKTCLHLLHIIWAQPSSFSIGTAHIGQHLMSSESKAIPGTGEAEAWGQGLEGCHDPRQSEQNSVSQVGQWTWTATLSLVGPVPLLPTPGGVHTEQTVSHPALGHHASRTSLSTSTTTI